MGHSTDRVCAPGGATAHGRTLSVVTGVLCAVSLLAAPSGARAGWSVGLRVSANAQEGGVNLLGAAVLAPSSARCELRVSAGGRTKTLHSRRRGSVQWNWTEPVDAPKGLWTFLATCRAASSWAWRRYLAEPGFPEPGKALVDGHVRAGPGEPESCDEQGVCFAGDPFEIGQCGWYALGRRPDLLGIVGITHDYSGAWLEEAAGKVPEGSIPVVGAIAVWKPNIPHLTGPDGHVAYVVAVSGSRIFVDDSNWTPTPWSPPLQVHEHWANASAVTGYIYGGPAGSGA